MEITLLIGLPGSGKTTVAKQILGEAEEFIRGTRDEDGRSKTSKKYIADRSIILDDIRDADLDLPEPGKYDHIIITDVYLCYDSERDNAIDFLLDRYQEQDPKIMMVFFENSPEKCSANSMHREDPGEVLEHIKGLSEIYTIPEGAPVHGIWQAPKKSPFAPITVGGKTFTINVPGLQAK